ncbi:MAG TPA: glycerol-3-phosphate dehydrogenase/oxidase [Puia sp.]|jgi:glycerol-3-phosphate dehydrogenase
MTRQNMVQALEAKGPALWDICIIGGGATGLGVAVDAASRGFSTLLLERYDFAKGTSSRATKLVHGGVRYLQQGNIKLVTEALHERGLLRKNAPHLVKNMSFIVPNYKWWEGPFYGIGLKVYDWMAGSLGLGKSRLLSREETLELAPTLDGEGLRGGVLYHDGQFDDARLAIHLAMTAAGQGAVLLNYCRVDSLVKKEGKVAGVVATDEISGKTHTINARVVINATGVFTDSILRMDDAGSEPIIAPSQGVHIMLDKDFLPGDAAILVPHTDDGRVLFAVPWHDKIIIGTTDTPVDSVDIEPRALPEEVDFILKQIGRYLRRVPQPSDIRSVYAGLRPLVKNSSKKTAELARDHLILVADSGLITITGGKWTTYRRMAEDTVNTAIEKAGLPKRDCVTADLPIHGSPEAAVSAAASGDAAAAGSATASGGAAASGGTAASGGATASGGTAASGGVVANDAAWNQPLHYYGTDAAAVLALANAHPLLGEKIHHRLPYLRAEIVWAAREELAMTVDDALSRRTRSLLLDAQAAIDAAPLVAALLAEELGRDSAWQDRQVEEFIGIAKGYLVQTPATVNNG